MERIMNAEILAVAKVAFTLSPGAALELAQELIKAVRKNEEFPQTVSAPTVFKNQTDQGPPSFAGLVLFHISRS